MLWLRFDNFCWHTNSGDTRGEVPNDHGAGADGHMITHATTIDNFRTCAPKRAFADGHLTGDIAGGHERGIVTNGGFMADRAGQVQNNMAADRNVRGDDRAGTNDTALPNGDVF